MSSIHEYAQFMKGCSLNMAAGMKNYFTQVCLLSFFFFLLKDNIRRIFAI